jgi:predicted nucleic acid-binding protein
LLEPAQHRALSEIARREERSISDLVRDAVRGCLQSQEAGSTWQRRQRAAERLLAIREALDVLEALLSLELEVVAPTLHSHRRALEWSALLGQNREYDGQYLAAAERVGAEL